jgi:hypothetical protein
LEPDHATLARFRRERAQWLRQVYRETVRLCAQAGLVLLELAATDGSKIAARSSRRSLYDDKRSEQEQQLIERILAEAEEADSDEEAEALRRTAAKREHKRARAVELQAEQGVKNVSLTEPESRIMKTKEGLRPAYNGQLTVDSAQGVIVAAEVIQQASDAGQLVPQLEQLGENLGLVPDEVLADTGYSDEGTLSWLAEQQQAALIPAKEHPQEAKRKDLFASRCFDYDDAQDVLVCPAGRRLSFRAIKQGGSGSYRIYTAERSCRDCSFCGDCVKSKKKASRSIWVSVIAPLRARMREKLNSSAGRARYRLRQQLVERVLANLKRNLEMDRFSVSGYSAVSGEWWLICSVHNLKIWGKRWAKCGCTAANIVLAAGMAVISCRNRFLQSRKRSCFAYFITK